MGEISLALEHAFKRHSAEAFAVTGVYLREAGATPASDKAKAIHFEDMGQAFACWKRTSSIRPFREDGQPNRPLTAYHISFETVDP